MRHTCSVAATRVQDDDVTTTIAGLRLRALRPDDADQVIALIGGVYAEYPGCVLDLPGVDDDLPVLAAHLAALGGRGWVVEDDVDVVAVVGVAPGIVDGVPGAELKRLYVAASHRRRGLGRQLVAVVEDHAVTELGAEAIELWSDSRFDDAHRLYERCGYVRRPQTRDLHDPSHTTEHRFVKVVAPPAP